MEIQSQNRCGSNKLKKMSVLFALVTLCYAGQASAGVCWPRTAGNSKPGGTAAKNYAITYPVTLSAKENEKGKIVTTDVDGKEMGWGVGGTAGGVGASTYLGSCDCTDTGYFTDAGLRALKEAYFTAVVPGTALQLANTEFIFYAVPGTAGEYLAVGSKVQIDGGVNGYQGYQRVPFNAVSNRQPDTLGCTTVTFNTGANGKVALYFIRPFVGEQTFSTTLMTLYAGTSADAANSMAWPLSVVTLNATIRVPQSCKINSGDMLELDVGNLYSSSFADKKGEDIGTPVSKEFMVNCSNISDGMKVSVKLATGSSGLVANNPNLIKTTNNDIGIRFVNTKAGNATVIPNQGEFPVDYSVTGNPDLDSGKVAIGAVPVSTTGKAPAEGEFSGVANLSVAVE